MPANILISRKIIDGQNVVILGDRFYDELVKNNEELLDLLNISLEHIEDMLKGDDGQAFKEARKFLKRMQNDPR